MTNRTSTAATPLRLSPSRSARASSRSSRSAGWGIRHIRRSWYSLPAMPSLEEAERRMRSHPGFIASLTPEQIAIIRAAAGPELWGNANAPRHTG
ncbi:MAG TPA: hypothetical protein VE871_06185 [Longimicrobium sp.]|nr:hypothetical protein [Longimicrobium sp.]